MGYTIDISSGYILGVGKCKGNGNGNEHEYQAVIDALHNRPHRDGYGCRLRADLTWEEYELPAVDETNDEISNEEAYNIIMGVVE